MQLLVLNAAVLAFSVVAVSTVTSSPPLYHFQSLHSTIILPSPPYLNSIRPYSSSLDVSSRMLQ